jgi:hypothetical protein
MQMMLRHMKIKKATIHSFWSSFRDWTRSETGYPREPIETALAHILAIKPSQRIGQRRLGKTARPVDKLKK